MRGVESSPHADGRGWAPGPAAGEGVVRGLGTARAAAAWVPCCAAWRLCWAPTPPLQRGCWALTVVDGGGAQHALVVFLPLSGEAVLGAQQHEDEHREGTLHAGDGMGRQAARGGPRAVAAAGGRRVDGGPRLWLEPIACIAQARLAASP